MMTKHSTRPRLDGRFWEKIDRGPDGFHSQTGTNLGPCWLWTGSLTANGYAQFRIGGRTTGRTFYAHHLTYEAFVGPIEKPQLDHLCRVRHCCNPRHLEPVTAGENIARGTRLVLKTHCKRGHAMIGDNVRFYTWPDGSTARFCRACNLETGAARMRRLRAKWKASESR